MKKLVALLCMMICVFSLTACAKSDTTNDSQYDPASLREGTEMIIEQLGTMDDASLEKIVNSRNEEIAADDEIALMVKASYKSWLDTKEELGAYTPAETDTFTVEEDEDGATATLEATFANRPAKVIAHFNYAGQLESFRFEPVYTTMESLANAGLNTVLGMGTVFIVLIFIAFLISLFKYINKAEAYFANKKKVKEASVFVPADPADAPVVLDTPEEECVDDLELVAVITAAVAASMNTSADQLVVRSIKRKSTNKWQKA